MNGRISPDPPTTQAGDFGRDESTLVGSNDSTADHDPTEIRLKSSPPRPKSAGNNGSLEVKENKPQQEGPKVNGDEDGVDSEAETLIDSPVKRQQAERRRSNAAKMERPPKHRIGSLPVPTGNDDEDDSANVSPAPSTVMSVEKTTSTEDIKDANLDTMGDDKDDDSDSLSSARSNASGPPSRRSSMSRAASERPGLSRNDQHSPNPRKRKHRASSVSLPNKRPSIDIPKRRLRGLHSEELGRNDESLSPKLRSHRRAVSTQSAFTDGVGDAVGNRKRRSGPPGIVKEPKSARSGWEESDASSETTSHGNPDSRRPQRGVGRSTSTPGRPAGREHKRHVNKYGFTRLAEACENGDLDLVKDWREKDPDQLELAEFAGNKPLQIAALNGNVEVVDYLIDQGCQIDCANVDKDTPLIDAAENGHLDVVNSLLNAGVDPLRQNLKGQQALDVVTDEVDDADDIRATLRKAIEKWNSTGAKQKREEAEEMRHRAGPSKELHFMARTYENLLRLVQNNDRTGVREFLDARVPVDNAVVAAAAKTGDTYLVNMLLAEMTEKKAHQKAEKPLLGVLGSSHFEMVQSLTELDNFNPLFRNRQQKTWPEIAEERHGPNWRQEYELLQRLFDQAASIKERRSSSPVTKRDSGKRRFVHRAEEEDSEDEEEAPKRRNNRKLMSKREQREFRAARGKPASDESSDDSSSEHATGADAAEEKSMKPPESPVSKRTPPTRSRTKSLSAQPPEPSPRTRRRSSSVRGAGDHPLPTVQENTEEKEAAEKQREEEAKKLAEEVEHARLAEVQRKEQEQAEAEAAAQRAAKEAEARRMEEERKAEEARRIEEERKAQAVRDAEEERIRKQREAMEAQEAHRQEVMAALPNPVAHVLNPGSGFHYSDKDGDMTDLTYIIRIFTPLQVIKQEYAGPHANLPASDDAPFWVINVQVAPLLGPRGVELMISRDKPGFEGSLAAAWDTKDVPDREMPLVMSLLGCADQELPDDLKVPKDDLSFDQANQRANKLLRAKLDVKKRLRDGAATLRYVRLDDVFNNLHPLLRHPRARIPVRFDHFRSSANPVKGGGSFFTQLGSSINGKPRPRTYVNGRPIDLQSPVTATGTTQVATIRPKK